MKPLNRGASRGFTLVELVLVLTIAGVLATVAVPRMVDRSAFQTHGGAAEVRTALRYAQKLAMAKNREVCVTTTANNLTLTFEPTIASVCGVAAVIRPGGDPVSEPTFRVVLPASITLAPVAQFRFDGQGRPSTPISLTVVGGSSSVQVTVEQETGYVH
ncbi:MAG: prepilin-type N-terminal cleavage/methylation domain-containing protein [Thiobacillus sp.]|nr:prepilin-type N-terminal cleavage/methylation domain-containing protein [Thiobacillus sp.]